MAENNLEYPTLPGLWQEYDETERSFSFKADKLCEAREWQQRFRGELTSLLGGFPNQTCDLNPQFLGTRKEDGFTCDLIAIQTLPGEFMSCFRR